MTKRRVTKKQLHRIENIQSGYRQKDDSSEKDILNDGLVICRFSKHAHVEDVNGKLIHCAIRPNIDSIVAGDKVVWQEEGESQGIIISRYQRQSVLGRPDNHNQIKPIAANITQIIIVIAPIPEISWSLLDSYIVMAEYLKIHPYILLNKTDLECDNIQKELLKYYEPLGYPILFNNNKNKDNKSLGKLFNNQVSVLVGQSGVGKSSIIASILPNQSSNIATQSVSSQSGFGCHTTSNSKYYHLPHGGAIIDSPGIRELKLWNMPKHDIALGYREFRQYISQCKFRNCTHIDTPGCAVSNAIKNKQIYIKRYENYVKMFQST
jgi:ribosome biogenesis GTPase